GIVESTIIFATGEPDLADAILFVIVLAALLFQRRGVQPRVDEDQSSTWQAAREVRPIPSELAVLPELQRGVRGLRGPFALFLAVVTLALALATSSVLLKPNYVSWIPTGRLVRTPLFGRVSVASEDRMYYLCLVALVIAVAMVRGIRNSRTGRVLIAVRENS